jgi:hypothetical protein
MLDQGCHVLAYEKINKEVTSEKQYLEKVDELAEMQNQIRQKYIKQLTQKAVDTGCHQILRELVKYELKSISLPR